MDLQQFLYYAGAFTASSVLFKTLNFARIFLRPSSLPRYLHAGKKSWALVTGSSDGIGMGFAQELCSRGFNVILHGRNAKKLAGVKESLNRDFPQAQVRIVVQDALNFSESSLKELAASIGDLHLTILVNNVGGTDAVVSHPFKTFESSTYSEVENTMTLNLKFTTLLTKTLLPTLARNGPSLIMNTGSFVDGGVPYVCTYSSSKAYLNAFTRALGAELWKEGSGIETLCLLVGPTVSGQNVKEASMITPSSRTIAAASLDRVGCGQPYVVPYLPHALQRAVVNSLPEGLAAILIAGKLKPMADNKVKVF